ncbi:MAG TPA: porin family protein, partial [Verrucomicrobiae bacterium]|nr:porin family protein [Verrucomicrobiae bacterium]
MKPYKCLMLTNLAMVAALFALPSALAEETTSASNAEQTEALAKAAQNPVANMISVPFQNNFNFNVGPNNATQYILNVQPVIPFSLNERWNLITRTIMPIINQPSPAPGVPSAAGLGDINPTFFFSPAKSGKLIYGFGPTVTLPTATDSMLGSGLWSAGPAAVVLTMQGKWVIGTLANQQWSFAGWGDHYVSAFLAQPFVNYNLPDGWYLVSAPIITANWAADADNVWTVPVGGGLGKIQRIGKLPMNFQIQAFYNAVTPDYGP